MTMRNRIFVTGGSGFVGKPLLAALRNAGRPVIALDRSGTLSRSLSDFTGITVLRGDLLEPATYREALRSCDIVLHLAAATGRASAEEHIRVNARGTEVLLDECRRSGVRNVLFVSSIATTFPDKSGYHYAQAKSRAEEAVAHSGLRFAVLRPTIILGPGAPILKALEKLVLLPFVVVPGNGRVRVQPTHVDDVVKLILATVRDDLFVNETFEIGGPETVTMEELLQRLRRARTGRAGRVLHIPLGLLRPPLRLAEAMGLGSMLPISAGQLSSFRFDGVAAGNRLQERLRADSIGLPEMVSGHADGTAVTTDPLDAECRVFTRYLLGCDPDAYVNAKYKAAHAVLPALSTTGRFDEALIAFARTCPLWTKVADAYAGLFSPAAALRKRLVLLLAILETRPPFHGLIDKTVDGPAPLVVVRLVTRTTGAVLCLLVGALVFLPTRAVLTLARRVWR